MKLLAASSLDPSIQISQCLLIMQGHASITKHLEIKAISHIKQFQYCYFIISDMNGNYNW